MTQGTDSKKFAKASAVALIALAAIFVALITISAYNLVPQKFDVQSLVRIF
jgi:hypothetical protein